MTNQITEKTKLYAEIIEFFKSNPDIFEMCVEQLDDLTGYLPEDFRYYDMDLFDEIFAYDSPTELAYRVFYGRDNDTYTLLENGEKAYAEFNPNRDYFILNAYDHLISTNYKDYTLILDRYFIDEVCANFVYMNVPNNTLFDLLDKLSKCVD